MYMQRKVTLTSKKSNQGQIASIRNTLKTATVACSTLLEQDGQTKCAEHYKETTSEVKN